MAIKKKSLIATKGRRGQAADGPETKAAKTDSKVVGDAGKLAVARLVTAKLSTAKLATIRKLGG